MTNALLFAIACILSLGFVAVLAVLCEIRDSMSETNGHVERLTDEIVDEDFPPPPTRKKQQEEYK